MTLLESISPTARELLKRGTRNAERGTEAVLLRVSNHRLRLIGFAEGPQHDLHLTKLTIGLGFLAWEMQESSLKACDRLEQIAAYGLGWLEAFKEADDDVIALVSQEREHQRQLFRERQISFDCASPVVDPRRKLRVLVEEIGEVAEAIDLLECATRHERRQRQYELQSELVQVVAVCVAWLESLETRNAERGTRKDGAR